MRAKLSATVFLALIGCGSHSGQTPRSLVGDGNQPLLPIASDETVTIAYSGRQSPEGSVMITIKPDGEVRYELIDHTTSSPQTILVNQLELD